MKLMKQRFYFSLELLYFFFKFIIIEKILIILNISKIN